VLLLLYRNNSKRSTKYSCVYVWVCVCTDPYKCMYVAAPCLQEKWMETSTTSWVISTRCRSWLTAPSTSTSVDVDVDSILSSLNSQVENFNARGSGFVIERVSQFVLIITKYRPLHGRSFIPTPQEIQKRKCIVNVENYDQKCFMLAILSCLYEAPHHKERIAHYIPYANITKCRRNRFSRGARTNTPFRTVQSRNKCERVEG